MKNLTTAVIMAGGEGTRLRAITGDMPKAMVNIHGTDGLYRGTAKDTILAHQIDVLSSCGITDFVLVVGNKKEYIQRAFTNDTMQQLFPGRGINISYFEEERPMGTGGSFCFKELQNMIESDDFLFTYSDVLFDVNIGAMMQTHENAKADATVLISPCGDPDDRPLCGCKDGTNVVTSLIPKQGKTDGARSGYFRNTPKNGLMILNKSMFSLLPSTPEFLDMEANILLRMIYGDDYVVVAHNTPCYVKDIGTVDRFHEGEIDLKNNLPVQKNPSKTKQYSVILNESDIFSITPNGEVIVDNQMINAIAQFNNSGVLTLLFKDVEALDSSVDGDKVVDTLLVRRGGFITQDDGSTKQVGAFVNERIEEHNLAKVDELSEEWNMPRSNMYIFERSNDDIMCTNIGSQESFVSGTVEDATMRLLSTINQSRLTEQNFEA